MVIERDGFPVELTAQELREAYEEHQLNCMKEDIRSTIEQNENANDCSDKTVTYLAEQALYALSKNDAYFEAFWYTVEDVVADYFKDNHRYN